MHVYFLVDSCLKLGMRCYPRYGDHGRRLAGCCEVLSGSPEGTHRVYVDMYVGIGSRGRGG